MFQCRFSRTISRMESKGTGNEMPRMQEMGMWRKAVAAYENLRQLAREEVAVTAIEYGLLASLVALATLGGITLLGDTVGSMWQMIADAVLSVM